MAFGLSLEERKRLLEKHYNKDGFCGYCYCDFELSMGSVSYPCDTIVLLEKIEFREGQVVALRTELFKEKEIPINWGGGK